MDFTIKKYGQLLYALIENGYEILPFKEYMFSGEPAVGLPVGTEQSQRSNSNPVRSDDRNACSDELLEDASHKRVILRHDVDRFPENSLRLAQLENDLGIVGTYFFRIVPESYELRIMNEIAALGHEIGYHYEDVDLTYRGKKQEVRSQNSDLDEEMLIDCAYESFCRNLDMLRRNFDIKTACMHGSPRSKYDNRIIWEKYSYRDLGIIGEPYFDVDFNEFAYFTDSGRRWNGDKVTLRDRVNSQYSFDLRSTQQIIDSIATLPDKLMFTIHPQRWNDSILPWANELVSQNLKNLAKRFLVAKSNI